MLRAILVTLATGTICAAAVAADSRDDVDFERGAAPILVRHCASCHNASDPAGGLDLTQHAAALAGGESASPAIVPGDPAGSYLLERVRAGEMPPEGKGPRLTPAELAMLEGWIAAGARWPEKRVLSPFEFTSHVRAGRDWWSLAPPVRPAIPQVGRADRVRTPIDAFVLAILTGHSLEPAAEADRATLIRRASLDLHGLPPTRDQIEQFVNDTAADAYEQLVDRLLASPRYGERWARHWLDVVRFGESNGYETNGPRANAWPYRDWVIQAFNDDLSYPQFILQQLAGDQVGADAATGFLVGGTHDVVSSPDVELTLQQRLNDLDDVVSTTSATFLGLTVGCAKCHDHKFDPVAQRDYYALQAIFAGVQHGERELRTPDSDAIKKRESQLKDALATIERQAQQEWMRHQPPARLDASTAGEPRAAVNARLNVDRFAPARARLVRFTILTASEAEPCLDELEIFTTDEPARNLALAAAGAKATASSVYANGESQLHRVEHVNDGRYGNGRSWISGEVGTGWVQIELPQTATIDCVAWARDRDGSFRDRLPTRYRIEVSDAPDQWKVVATNEDRGPFDPHAKPAEPMPLDGLSPDAAERVRQHRGQAAALGEAIAKLAPPKIYAGTYEQPPATHLLYRGEPLQQRDVVSPGGIPTVGSPLTLPADAPEAQRRLALARWIGDPRNPLAARVMVNRIWHYHFGQGLVKSPSDFGFNGGVPSHPQLLDWLATEFMAGGWHPKAIHRLILLSSTYRQASRYHAGAAAQDAGNRLLWRYAPRRLEAEPIRDAVLWISGVLDLRMGGPGYEVFEPNTNYVKVYVPKQAFGPAEWRRMVYQNKPRMRLDATFGEFDCPDASQTMARRNTSTTALQSLNMLNGSFMMQQAGLFAARLEREAPGDAERQVQQAFWLAFGRAPDADELAAARRLIDEQGLLLFCRALYNANEFLYLN